MRCTTTSIIISSIIVIGNIMGIAGNILSIISNIMCIICNIMCIICNIMSISRVVGKIIIINIVGIINFRSINLYIVMHYLFIFNFFECI
jgi:hypothetical protein